MSASLEVSFFRPFYGAYNVLVLDPQYRYAMVAGPNRIISGYSRATRNSIRRRRRILVERAKAWGFASDTLIYVEHRNTPIMAD